MSISPKVIRRSLLVAVYFLSLYCFTETSTYESIQRLTASRWIALAIVNLPIVGATIISLLSGFKVNKAVFVIAVILLMPSIISQSKLNWIENIWGIDVRSSMGFSMITVCVFLVVIGCMVISGLTRYGEQCEGWGKNGASTGELNEIYTKWTKSLYFFVTSIIIIGVIVAVVGSYMTGDVLRLEPAPFASVGIVVAAICIYGYVYLYEK